MKNKEKLPGLFLILGAIGFWLSWVLMPDPGTTDAEHILNVIGQSRPAVLFSVIIQVCSSAFYLLAILLLLLSNQRFSVWARWGAILLGLGAMGFYGDAFFHLLAYYMTDSRIESVSSMVAVMHKMQTDGLIFLVPVFIPLFPGNLLLAKGLHAQKLISRLPYQLAWIFFAGVLLIMATHRSRILENTRFLTLFVLGIFSVSQAWMGIQLMKERVKHDLTI